MNRPALFLVFYSDKKSIPNIASSTNCKQTYRITGFTVTTLNYKESIKYYEKAFTSGRKSNLSTLYAITGQLSCNVAFVNFITCIT